MVIVSARSRAWFFPIRSAFPAFAPGRRPHHSFRGPLRLYSRYAGLLAHLSRTLSRGFDLPGYPDLPLARYRI